MQQLISNLKIRVADFIEQRQDLILLLQGDLGGVSLSVSLLRELEQYPGTDLFLIVSGVFTDIESWVDQVIQQIRAECDLANMAMEQDGQESLAPIPEELNDDSAEPLERFRRAISYCKSLLPEGGGHRLVVGLFPAAIVAADQFQQMLVDLSPQSGFERWMSDVRIVGYDHPGANTIDLESVRGLQVQRLDFTHASIERALTDDAANESLSDEQRVNAVHQLAIYDYGFGRLEDSHEKFDYLLGYYQGQEDLQMQALVMQGKGDVFRKQKKYDQARHWYECGILPAEQAKSVAVLQAILRSLGELEREAGRSDESMQYLQHSSSLAAARGDVTSMSCCEEHQVHNLMENRQPDQAATVLEGSTARSRELGLDHELEQQLEMLVPVYEAQGNESGLADAKSELARVKGDA